VWPTYQDTITQRITYRHLYSSKLVLSRHPKKVLDVGCGSGALLSCLPSQVFGVGLEYTEAQAQISVSNGCKNIVIATAFKMPFAESTFDGVCILEVLEHIDIKHNEEVLKESKYILANNGKIIISVPFDSWLSKIMDPAWILGHRHYSTADLRRQITRTGFFVQEMRVKGGWWEMLAMINLYVSKWVFGKDMLFRAFFERKRQCEYDVNETGFATLFAVAEKRGI
jgi:2-polyprenyl-3-methyl-5-hydroxy-6-metoxy-1,4-benzoquinol methylase